MKLYKRKESPYFMACYHDHAGNRVRKSTGTDVRKNAVKIATRWEYEASQGPEAVPESVPFSACLERYRKVQLRDHAKSYHSATKYRLNTLACYFGDIDANDITSPAVEEFMDERLESLVPRTARKVSLPAVQREVSILRAILNKAYKDGKIGVEPRFPELKKINPRDRWLTEDEENRLCAAVSGYAKHLAPFIRLACDTGGRSGELLALDWKHVDLANRRLTFKDTKNGGDRTIRLCQRAVAVLSALGPKDSGPVFTYKGESITKIRSAFATARDKANVPDVHIHDLRHTFASRLVQAGVPLYDVMTALGHKSLDMVQRYAHLAPDYQDRVVAALDKQHGEVDTLFDTLPKPAGKPARLAS